MKSLLIGLAFLLVSILSCKSKPAFDYSESVVSIERSLGPALISSQKKIIESFQENRMDTILAVSRRVVGIIDGKIEEIKSLKLPDVKEGENFRSATLRHFTNLRNAYAGYGQIAMQPTDEAKEAERQKVLRIEQEGRISLGEMQRAQRKYAEANGFKVK